MVTDKEVYEWFKSKIGVAQGITVGVHNDGRVQVEGYLELLSIDETETVLGESCIRFSENIGLDECDDGDCPLSDAMDTVLDDITSFISTKTIIPTCKL